MLNKIYSMKYSVWPKGKQLPFNPKELGTLLQKPLIKPVVKTNKKNGKR